MADVNEVKKVEMRFEDFNSIIKGEEDTHIPRQLYKSLFYEFDLAILFGPTHCGKTLFATMIAEEICRAFESFGYEFFKVIYVDMEMTEKQLQVRYNNHVFPDTLYRAAFNEEEIIKYSVDKLFERIESEIEDNCVTVVIFDTITYFGKGKNGSSFAPIMQKLKDLKGRWLLSILVVAHTAKRNDSSPINITDLMGGPFLSAIADSIFAMNKSCKGKDIVYVKQLKSRYSEIEYGADNVLEYKIEKDANGTLGLNLLGNTTEDEQVGIDYIAQQDLEDNIRFLNSKGWSLRKIAEKLKVSPSKVYRCLH